MSSSRIRDLAVGTFVLIGLCAIAYLSLSVGGVGQTPGGLKLYAVFDQVADLKPRAPVEISGVKVGQVVGVSLEPDTYRARVDIDVDAKLKLPVDSSASIVTAGLLGDRYLAIELGAEEETLVDGEQIAYTESALVLERIIGKAVHNFGGGNGSSEDKGGEAKKEASE
jgi:phospholipid/cholesterol/gamma-HCH transport system substrate-binding protein